jgi:hypothetical protein
LRTVPLPESARGLSIRLCECSCEIGLAGKAERKGNVDQRPMTGQQQRFCALKAPAAHIVMGRLPHRFLEGSRKVVSAQAGDRGHGINRQLAFKVGLDVVEHPEQSAPVQPFSPDRQ